MWAPSRPWRRAPSARAPATRSGRVRPRPAELSVPRTTRSRRSLDKIGSGEDDMTLSDKVVGVFPRLEFELLNFKITHSSDHSIYPCYLLLAYSDHTMILSYVVCMNEPQNISFASPECFWIRCRLLGTCLRGFNKQETKQAHTTQIPDLCVLVIYTQGTLVNTLRIRLYGALWMLLRNELRINYLLLLIVDCTK